MHLNAPLTPEGRLRLCRRLEAGWTVAAAAESMNLSRQCAHQWWRRYRLQGSAGLLDHSSRPHRSPHRTSPKLEFRVRALRQRKKWGPVRIAAVVGLAPSTVHRILVRHGLNRLQTLERATGEPVRRIQTDHPGQLVHIDVKKLARIPDGGGHRVLDKATGLRNQQRSRVGYAFIHSAIDAHSRLAYSEIRTSENTPNSVDFLKNAHQFFSDQGIHVERVLTDNGGAYRSLLWARQCRELELRAKRTRPYRPATNGKVERYNRTLLDEWAYVRPFTSDLQRAATLPAFLDFYNHHRFHAAIKGVPASRVTNFSGHHS